MNHDIFREHYNAMAFAGLPPGPGGSEATREANTTSAFQLFVPLTWLFFTRSEDYAFTPEALSSELDLLVLYRGLNQLVYARTGGGAVPGASPFTTSPTISATEFFQQLVYVPNPEKNAHLATFETEQGNIFKILDVEEQRNTVIEAAANTYRVKIDNSRLDAAFIMFSVRDILMNTDWAIDRGQSDSTATILPGAGSVAALQPITSFQLTANGRVVVDTCTDIENRAVWRDMYLSGTQIGEPIYFIPFSWLLKDPKNVTSFQNMGTFICYFAFN